MEPIKLCWRAEAKGNRRGALYIYGAIYGFSWWEEDVSPDRVRKDLEEMGDIDALDIYINSPGGSVLDAEAICAEIGRLKGKGVAVDVYIDGMAASAASVIALLGNEITMSEGAYIMIHDPWVYMAGDAAELRKEADLLDEMSEQYARRYARRTGMDEKEVRAMMAEETWISAEKALELGFCTRIAAEGVEAEQEDEGARSALMVACGRYANMPEDLKARLKGVAGHLDPLGLPGTPGRNARETYGCPAGHVGPDGPKGAGSVADDGELLELRTGTNNEGMTAHVAAATASGLLAGAQAVAPGLGALGADTNKEGERIMDLVQLRTEHPELVSEILAEGAKAERERLQALDALPAMGCEEVIATAKYGDDKERCGAETVAMRLWMARAEKDKALGAAALAGRQQDAAPVNGVAGTGEGNLPGDLGRDKAQQDADIKAMAEGLSLRHKA